MAEILLDAQGVGTTPATSKLLVYPDSSTKQLTALNDTGRKFSLDGVIRNWNTVDVVANAADTYLAGSNLIVPQHLLQAGATLKWRLIMTKTAAGVATPVWTVRVGTTGTVADAARLTFTGGAQTAAIDTGFVEFSAVLRNIGAAGVLAGGMNLVHNLATTGFATIASEVLQATSAGFDTTVAGLIIGISVNPGSAGVWTHQLVVAEMSNM
jgi:hypothetical protein